MIDANGQPHGPCLPIEARVAVIERDVHQMEDDRRRTNEKLEQIDRSLIAVLAGNTAILDRLTDGSGRMDDHDKRIEVLEKDKTDRDAERRTRDRHGKILWSGAIAFGAAGAWLWSQGHALLQILLGSKPG